MAAQLWLLRHGEAVPHEAAPDDSARPLTARGEGQAQAAGRALVALRVNFQFAYTSPKLRALHTAELACAELGLEAVPHAPLAEGFDLGAARELLLAAPEKRTLLVGHDPDFTQLVCDLTGARIDLKKGGIAAMNERELLVLLRPRELDRLAASGSAES